MLARQVKARIEANRNRRSLPNWRKPLIIQAAAQIRETVVLRAQARTMPLPDKEAQLLDAHEELLKARIRDLQSRRWSKKFEPKPSSI